MAAAVAAILLVLLSGGGRTGVPDELARLAPPDALAWIDVAPHDAAAGRAWTMASRFPALRTAPQALASRLGLRGFEPGRDLRPWVGDELGIALTADGPLVLAMVDDAGAARRTLARLGARPAGRADGAALLSSRASPGDLVALTGDRLVAGPAAAVRAALARAAGRGAGLSSLAAYSRAAADRGDGVALAYAPAVGVARLLAASDPLVRAGAALLGDPRVQAVAAVAQPEDGGVRVHGRIVRTPGPAPAGAAPTLLGRVPADVAAMLLLPNGASLAALAGRLGGAALVAGVRTTLSNEAGVDLDRDVLGPLRESVLSLQARGDVPVVTLAARTTTPELTREALARVQSPLAARLTGAADQAFRSLPGGGFSLPVTPQLQPTYAVDGDVLVAGTAQPALDERRLAGRGIAQAPTLARADSGRQGTVQALGFLDLHQLLGLGERTGLATTPGFQAVNGALGPVRTAGAVLAQDTDHPTDTTAELFLEIP